MTASPPGVDRAHAVLDGIAENVRILREDGENGSLIDDALPRCIAAVRAALAWADEDDARRDDYRYPIRNGLAPSPGDEIRALLTAALTEAETTR